MSTNCPCDDFDVYLSIKWPPFTSDLSLSHMHSLSFLLSACTAFHLYVLSVVPCTSVCVCKRKFRYSMVATNCYTFIGRHNTSTNRKLYSANKHSLSCVQFVSQIQFQFFSSIFLLFGCCSFQYETKISFPIHFFWQM